MIRAFATSYCVLPTTNAVITVLSAGSRQKDIAASLTAGGGISV
ncbi:MAG: hypothetical protein ACLVIZ_00725 [Bifidobacterium pseudocatenulatum]